jgi:hypothetical protein
MCCPLASRGVASIIIAEVLCDDAIVDKIRDKHPPLTFPAVRQALIYARDVQAGWEEDEEHGRRVVARGMTYVGTPFVAYLSPLNENDPEEGTFKLKTAIPKPD